MKTGCGKLYVTINEDENGRPFEVFTNMGKAGGCASSQAEAIGRLISLSLRSNIETDEIVKQLKGISCHETSWGEEGRVLSCSDAIAKALEGYIPTGHIAKTENGNGSRRLNSTISLPWAPVLNAAALFNTKKAAPNATTAVFTKC